MNATNLYGFQLNFKNKEINIGAEQEFLHLYRDSAMPVAIQEDNGGI